ncbi:SDR family oxidoreductase [Geminicoccus roseus]|uniref:SDR family oxidoreductase n=1 Tax=Geminicoccus roseus TaxID=404900 RepID=UPI00041E3D92|nr:SDR family oxidoreductase [Geminicoccus roseus]
MTVEPTLRLPAGYRVLVTAGASGIGLAITLALLKAGARVHVCDVDEAALSALADEHLNASVSLCDVAVDEQVEQLFLDVQAQLGGLDGLVNNAGIAGPTGAIETIEPAEWRRCLDVDITAMFLVTRKAVPLLKRNLDGCIVNMSSAAGRFGYAYRTPYAAAKWGVIGFTQSLAKELGPAGIRVNAILPGIVEGPRMEGVIRARAEETGVSFTEMERQYLERTSLRRMVSGDDVAGMVLFLCSSLGRNVSGQSLGVCANVESL